MGLVSDYDDDLCHAVLRLYVLSPRSGRTTVAQRFIAG
jgi:hypothetical protein